MFQWEEGPKAILALGPGKGAQGGIRVGRLKGGAGGLFLIL